MCNNYGVRLLVLTALLLAGCAHYERGNYRALPVTGPVKYVARLEGAEPYCTLPTSWTFRPDETRVCPAEQWMRSIDERPLLGYAGGAYRISYSAGGMWSPGRVIRIDWHEGRGYVTRKQGSVRGPGCGRDNVFCIHEVSREVTAAEWRRVDDCFSKIGFFGMPRYDAIHGEIILDAPETWTIEGVSGGAFNVVERIEPTMQTKQRRLRPLIECAKVLLAIGGEDLGPNAMRLDRLDG